MYRQLITHFRCGSHIDVKEEEVLGRTSGYNRHHNSSIQNKIGPNKT